MNSNVIVEICGVSRGSWNYVDSIVIFDLIQWKFEVRNEFDPYALS